MDIQKYQDELTKRKDAFWARKVVHLSGIKAFIQITEDPRRDLISSLIARDIIEDLKDRYGNKNHLEMGREMIKDVEEMLTLMLEEADKELAEEADQPTQH